MGVYGALGMVNVQGSWYNSMAREPFSRESRRESPLAGLVVCIYNGV